MKQANPVAVATPSLVDHPNGGYDKQNDAGPTEEDGVAFWDVTERFAPPVAATGGAAL